MKVKLHSEFEASPGYTIRIALLNNNTSNNVVLLSNSIIIINYIAVHDIM